MAASIVAMNGALLVAIQEHVALVVTVTVNSAPAAGMSVSGPLKTVNEHPDELGDSVEEVAEVGAVGDVSQATVDAATTAISEVVRSRRRIPVRRS
jgi:hypothetical protein